MLHKTSDEPEPRIAMRLKMKLYLGRILSAWGDRMWQFAIGLYFIKLYPDSFLLAAIQGIISSVMVFLTAPIIGKWIERTARLKEMKVSLFLQNGSIALAAICVAIHEVKGIDEKISQWVSWVGLIGFSVVAQVWSVGFTNCLEKDWILCIAGNGRQLTELNAWLRRLDLICNVLAPSLVGLVVDVSLLWSAIFLSVWNVFSGGVEYALLRSIYHSVPALRTEKSVKVKPVSMTTFLNISAFVMYAKEFLWPGMSFAFVYLTVLGFDPITIGYASGQGIEGWVLGLVSVGASIFGVLGTVIYPLLVRRVGVKTTGVVGFVSQIICLTVCLVVWAKAWVPNVTTNVALVLIGISCSRFGLWIADMAVNQLIQTETSSPPVVGSVQTSVNTLMELMKFVVVLFLADVHQFHILALISYVSVLSGALLFTFFVIKSRKNI